MAEAPDEVAPVTNEVPDRPRPGRRSVLLWVACAAVAVALDGVVGGLVAVVVAAVLLAGLPPRSLGGLGVVALAAVPFAVILQGVPTTQTVSPGFVSATMWPHHLAFAGVVWAGAGAVLDLWPHLASLRESAAAADPVAAREPVASWPVPLRVAVVVGVAIAAAVASVAVMGA